MNVIKTFWVLLVVAFVSVGAISFKCRAKCDKTFAKVNKASPLSEPCKRGCRLFSIHDATRHVDPFFAFDLSHIGWNSPADEETLNKCHKDCSYAYEEKKSDESVSACSQGCTIQQQVEHEKTTFDDGFKDGISISFGRPGLLDFNTNIFEDIDRMMARTRSNLPSFMSFSRGNNDSIMERKKTVEAGQEGTSPFHSMFDSVHKNVQNLMENILGKFNQHMTAEQKQTSQETIDNKAMKTKMEGETINGGGKLVVIQDGPGYHNEKTYNFGPDADAGKIFKEKMNDMMEHRNPLENFFRNEDVEMIDPYNLSNQKEEDKEENKKQNIKDRSFDIEVLGPFNSDRFEDSNSKENIENNRNIGLNFDDWVIGPKLPETGLKSRPLPIHHDVQDNNLERIKIIVGDGNYEDVCSQDTRQMKWSDWVSCLHTRLGLPRWLMAATVCMGIIFTLWICLVIPANAPKQKVKKSKKSIGTKELEADSLENPHLAVIAVHKAYPLDLPPSYDDVTQTKVNLEPVHEKINQQEEAEALPDKTQLQNESQA